MICRGTLTFVVVLQLAINSLHHGTVESSPVGLKTVLNDDPNLSSEIRSGNLLKGENSPVSIRADENLHHLSADVVDENPAKSLFQTMGAFVKNRIAPAASYVNMVNRYHKWFQNYKAFKKVSKRELPEATDILKSEYTTAENILIKEELSKPVKEEDFDISLSREESKEKRMKNLENMDFVFRALKLMIDRLEMILKNLENQEGLDVEGNGELAIGESVDQEDVKRSMERVRRSVMSAAKNVLKGELTIIARTAALNGLAAFMEAKPDTGDALDQLRPIIALLGSATTPLAVAYLSSIEFRAGLAIANTFNPLAHYMEKVKSEKENEQSRTALKIA